MTHDYQVQNKKIRNQKSEAKAEVKVDDDDDVTRAFIVQVRRLSLLFSTRWEEKTWNRTPKNIYTHFLCVLIKRNDYLKLLRSLPLAFFCFKLKLHNLTVNLIIHSAVQKNGTKRNKAESKCILNKNGWRKKFQCRRQKSVRQFVSLSAFWQLKLCELCFFFGFFSFQLWVLLSVLL